MTRIVDFADQSNVVMESLFDDDFVVVAAMGTPWTRRRRIDLAELVNEPWTLPPLEATIGTFAIDAFRARGLKPPRTAVITYSMHRRNRLLATGRFLTILPPACPLMGQTRPSGALIAGRWRKRQWGCKIRVPGQCCRVAR